MNEDFAAMIKGGVVALDLADEIASSIDLLPGMTVKFSNDAVSVTIRRVRSRTKRGKKTHA